MADDNLQSEIERLKAENERLKSDRGRTVRTLTEITLLCAERQKPQKTGSAWMHLATLYRSLS